MSYKWYALLVAQKKEFYVKNKIEQSENDLIANDLNELLLPVEKEIYEVRRKKVVRFLPIYPNYLFIHANLQNGLPHALGEITFIVRILGHNNKPTPIREQEIDLVKAMASGEKLSSAFKYKIGDMVEVRGGHCKGLSGRVIDILGIDLLKIEMQIFNRAIYANIRLEDITFA